MVRIDIIVSPDLAEQLLSGSAGPQRTGLVEAGNSFGVAPAPSHFGVSDDELRRFFHFDLPEPAAAEQLRTTLLRLPGVESAYIKPPAELP